METYNHLRVVISYTAILRYSPRILTDFFERRGWKWGREGSDREGEEGSDGGEGEGSDSDSGEAGPHFCVKVQMKCLV